MIAAAGLTLSFVLGKAIPERCLGTGLEGMRPDPNNATPGARFAPVFPFLHEEIDAAPWPVDSAATGREHSRPADSLRQAVERIIKPRHVDDPFDRQYKPREAFAITATRLNRCAVYSQRFRLLRLNRGSTLDGLCDQRTLFVNQFLCIGSLNHADSLAFGRKIYSSGQSLHAGRLFR